MEQNIVLRFLSYRFSGVISGGLSGGSSGGSFGRSWDRKLEWATSARHGGRPGWYVLPFLAGFLVSPFLLGLMDLRLARSAQAEITIDITEGVFEPLPVAIQPFALEGDLPEKAIRTLGDDIALVISRDLDRSGLFRPLAQASFIERPSGLDLLPRFNDWRPIGAQALVQGRVEYMADGRIKIDFRLWDTFAESQLAGITYRTVDWNWRRIAHIIADSIYQRMTGESGYFDSRIVYVAESGPKDARVKRLAIMDQDNENHRFITDGSFLALTPRFSPVRQELTYLSFASGVPRVYLLDLQTGEQEDLGGFSGMTFAPRFSHDGESVLMSHAKAGNTEIFRMNLRSREVVRLTNNSAIDTSPSPSPDGRSLVFTSDRGGSPQLYVSGINGLNVRRITFERGTYSTPAWSPRGDLIAFTKQAGGRFFIGVIRPDGQGERLLSESFLDEGPTWAPNGRVLLFFRQEPGEASRTRLYSVDLTGSNLREIPTPGDASDPAWSPINP